MHKTKNVVINNKEVAIDIECIPTVLLFNQIGLTTKFSCQGDEDNDFSIMFADCIEDKDIENFIIKFSNKYNHTPFIGGFYKWTRKMNGSIKSNWVYKVRNINFAKSNYEKMCKIIKL